MCKPSMGGKEGAVPGRVLLSLQRAVVKVTCVPVGQSGKREAMAEGLRVETPDVLSL